ncbi:AmpG family muropeptide MFS transporter [Labrys wisconsinensis]|uniref:PAT family beta-lactamase induction signal transducer AmpG n=1 Tax=Labrys wisconsinensis TaxID=425677 RepID=A0ABU0J363_9HYPH|nr:MFS transporter [Labrys wisconsinensis]MDQ0467878.1 PAT family beta-lactamase induction signal transducer AmpG [Labrys wisconsinensis]
MMPGAKLPSLLKTVAEDSRFAFMLALGFSSGLPFLLVFSTQSARLRESGISLTDIGLISYVALAYSFKFAWAPLIDRFDPPVLTRFLGRRRGWMLLTQLGVALGLLGLAFSDPRTALWPTIVCAAFTAFSAASQDVVIDGWRIDVAPTENQGMMLACNQLGYRLALLSAGAGAFYIADLADWRSAYLVMMLLMVIGMTATVFAPDKRAPTEVEASGDAPDRTRGDAGRPATLVGSFVAPLGDFVRRLGWTLVPILLLVAIYRLPDFVSGVMANPLYIDLGFSKSDIATVSKLYGVWVGLIGAFAGGIAVARLGLMPSLLFGGIAAAASHLSMALLAASGARYGLLTLAVSVENFAGSFAGTVLAAYMSSLTSQAFAATQYALLSSLYALPGKFIGGLSGKIVDTIGYPAFFVSTSTIGVPVAILCLIIWYASARRPEASPEAKEARQGAA